jgi:hypothetical protein
MTGNGSIAGRNPVSLEKTKNGMVIGRIAGDCGMQVSVYDPKGCAGC